VIRNRKALALVQKASFDLKTSQFNFDNDSQFTFPMAKREKQREKPKNNLRLTFFRLETRLLGFVFIRNTNEEEAKCFNNQQLLGFATARYQFSFKA
jgi:hypothetical protein